MHTKTFAVLVGVVVARDCERRGSALALDCLHRVPIGNGEEV